MCACVEVWNPSRKRYQYFVEPFFCACIFYQQKWIDKSSDQKNTYPKLVHEAHSDFNRNHSKFPKLQELDYHSKKIPPPPKFNSSPVKIGQNPKERIIFQQSIFRGYAKFRGCSLSGKDLSSRDSQSMSF